VEDVHTSTDNEARPSKQGSSDDSGLDELVLQLSERAQQWKGLTQELKRSKQREEDLRATNAEQTTRIDEVEKTLNDRATAASMNHQDPNLKFGMEYILGELGRTKAINEELKGTIKRLEDEARDNNWLRERNQVLERQLAEKTAEVDTTKEALNTLAGASSRNRPSREVRAVDVEISAISKARRICEQTTKFLERKGKNGSQGSNTHGTALSSLPSNMASSNEPSKRKSRDGEEKSDIKRAKSGSSLNDIYQD
jgi:hypothetical protein